MTLAAVLGATKVVAALAFLAVVLAIGAGYRALARRLEVERAEEMLAKEFERLDSDRPPVATSGGTGKRIEYI